MLLFLYVMLSRVLLISKEGCDEGDRSPEDSSESNQQSPREQVAVPPMSRFLRDESETAELQTLLTDCEAESVSQLRYVQAN